MTFEQWWELSGCRTVGEPMDYARAAWVAAGGEVESVAPTVPLEGFWAELNAHNEKMEKYLRAMR